MITTQALAAYVDRRLQQLRRARNLLGPMTVTGAMIGDTVTTYEAVATRLAKGTDTADDVLIGLLQMSAHYEDKSEEAGRHVASVELVMAA